MRRVSPLLLTVVAIYRLSLLGRGAMTFVDETWHYRAVLFLQDLRVGNVRHAFANLDNFGRPGDVLVRLIPGALQAIPFAFGLAPSNPVSLLLPTACNVIVTLITLALFYRICLLLFDGDQLVSLTASAVYSLLVNTNIYVRHTLPYDWALCVFVYALWLTLSRPPTAALAWTIGALGTAIGLIYPGYFPLAGILAVVFVARDATTASPWWRHVWRLGTGALVCIAGIDLLCRIGGPGYFDMMRRLGREQPGFVRGAYEGWIFVPRYLLDVEGYAGVLLLAGIVAYAARAFARRRQDGLGRRIHWVIVPAVAIWAAQAIASSPGRYFLFSGRVIHPWFLFLVWALGDAMLWVHRGAARRALCAAAVATALVSWAGFARAYARLDYPRDVLYQFAIDTARVPATQKVCEMSPVNGTYESPPSRDRGVGPPATDMTKYLLINFCQGFPTSEASRPLPTADEATLLFDAPHFMAFPAYAFEGFNAEDRRALRENAYRVRIYRTF
ncbi:MAG: hypothetical protein HY047_16680 [Acidobacteria bacterium]|nr:hypothetical protein [Acidobacteriota bacterium]